jgi:hypothetical protein
MRRNVRDHASSYGIDTNGLNHLYILEMMEKYIMSSPTSTDGSRTVPEEAMGIVQAMELSAARGSRLLDGVLDMLHSWPTGESEQGW